MYWNEQEIEERDFTYASESELDREEAIARGYAHPDMAWILTGRGMWHVNPYYVGKLPPHPEEDSADDYPPEDCGQDAFVDVDGNPY